MRSYKLSFTPAATGHVKEISLWYNKQLKGLGKRFKDNLKTELAEIKKNPFSRSYRYDEVRYAVVKKFPYAAHYTVDEETGIIIIHAVFGFKEDPDKWVKEI